MKIPKNSFVHTSNQVLSFRLNLYLFSRSKLQTNCICSKIVSKTRNRYSSCIVYALWWVLRHANWIQPIRFLDTVSPQYDPIRSSDGCNVGMRYSQWRYCYLKISKAKQLLLLGTFVLRSGHYDRKMGDRSTSCDQFISVYMTLLKQKYPDMKQRKFTRPPRNSGRVSFEKFPGIGRISKQCEREREMFYLTTHSTHFIYGYMASDIWLRTILIVRKETRCRHIGYSYRLTARVLLYAPSHRQDNTYHCLCYTSRWALAGTRNSSMGPPHEGSIR